MKTPTLKNLPFGSIIPNDQNYRNPNEYFPKGEEERFGMGKAILAGGIQAMTPLRISKRVKDKVETNVSIGGGRRYYALESQDAKILSELNVPCLVYVGLTETEELEISLSDNEHVAVSPWGNCKVVERLSKLGKSQSDIAERFNWSAPQVGNLLLLTRLEPWARTAGESGKISASLVWQLYNGQKGKKDEKISLLNTLLNSKREVIESQGVTAKDFGVKETQEAKSAELFNACVSAKATELAAKLIADKEVELASKVYQATYDIADKGIKQLISLDKATGDLFFGEFTEACKPLEGVKNLATYQGVTGTLVQLNTRVEAKVKELQAITNELVRGELLVKEQANTITPEERAQLVALTPGKVEPKGDAAPATPDTSGLKQGNNVQGPTIDDSFTVKTTVVLSDIIILCDKAIVTEKRPAGQVLDLLRSKVRLLCVNFQNDHKLVS